MHKPQARPLPFHAGTRYVTGAWALAQAQLCIVSTGQSRKCGTQRPRKLAGVRECVCVCVCLYVVCEYMRECGTQRPRKLAGVCVSACACVCLYPRKLAGVCMSACVCLCIVCEFMRVCVCGCVRFVYYMNDETNQT
jgi:hypothetical protein